MPFLQPVVMIVVVVDSLLQVRVDFCDHLDSAEGFGPKNFGNGIKVSELNCASWYS
ncbi:hypothetical protein KC19_VG105300 [Ceratodon purpureus]|uniref:Uncharacterized protein n=1 Tax=Ceratodon purpureus TaxID=3225 RepID=A0A8T0HP01_CERPU|nr:hypothetical protein KC19_VG105300 [Ceratodon purpureus]